MTRPFLCADLFCGAGGTSTGLARAAERAGRPVELLAVNHWPVAVETHAANHPWARHLCASLDGLDPKKAVGSDRLDLLVASPECTHHSTARGGKPISDQSRASAWHVVHWAEHLQPSDILVENVPEMRTWGPLGRDGKRLQSRKGETFEAWLGALRSLGYTIEHRVLNAADFGDPTTRRRLFVRARRGRRKPQWPQQTHATPEAIDDQLFAGGLRPWRTARSDVIDWSVRGSSIFARKKPLADATLRRIAEGLRRFGGEAAEPFLVLLRGTGGARGLDQPIPALTAGGEHVALAQPFLVPYYGEREGQAPRSHSVDAPVPTLPASSKFGVIEPFMLGQQSGGAPRAVGEPTPTVAAKGAVSLVEPYLVSFYGNGQAHRISEPLPTATTKDRFGLAQPLAQLDILFRMLQPHELARAMGFPRSYHFKGNRTDVVRQIGNAVAVGTAEALCSAILGIVQPVAEAA